jgi:hypothetical protein
MYGTALVAAQKFLVILIVSQLWLVMLTIPIHLPDDIKLSAGGLYLPIHTTIQFIGRPIAS